MAEAKDLPFLICSGNAEDIFLYSYQLKELREISKASVIGTALISSVEKILLNRAKSTRFMKLLIRGSGRLIIIKKFLMALFFSAKNKPTVPKIQSTIMGTICDESTKLTVKSAFVKAGKGNFRFKKTFPICGKTKKNIKNPIPIIAVKTIPG